MVNPNLGPGPVKTNCGPRLVNTNSGPGLVNTNWGPRLGARAKVQCQVQGPGNTKTYFRHYNEKVPVKKISCSKCSLNKTNYISSDEDDGAAAMHPDNSKDNVIMVGYKSSSLKQGEELGNSFEFYFQYFG